MGVYHWLTEQRAAALPRRRSGIEADIRGSVLVSGACRAGIPRAAMALCWVSCPSWRKAKVECARHNFPTLSGGMSDTYSVAVPRWRVEHDTFELVMIEVKCLQLAPA